MSPLAGMGPYVKRGNPRDAGFSKIADCVSEKMFNPVDKSWYSVHTSEHPHLKAELDFACRQ